MERADPILRSFFVRPILLYFESRGGDVSALMSRCDLPRSALDDGATPLPLSRFHAFVETAAEVLSDPFLGLHAAAFLPRGIFGVIEFCVRNSPTIGEAYRRLVRYNPMINDVTRVSYHPLDQGFELRHSVPGHPQALGRHANEMLVSFLVSASEDLLQAPFRPYRFSFAHPAPPDVSELVRALRVEAIEFGVGWNGFAVAAAYAEQKIASSNPAGLWNVDESTRPKISVDGRSATSHVRGLFHEALRNKVAVPDLEHAAKKMGISGRTLQRRLAEEGASFQGMRESARQELARVYMDEPRLTVGEVAFLLGYPEVAHFTRAFRRWTGMTPKEFRRTRGKVA